MAIASHVIEPSTLTGELTMQAQTTSYLTHAKAGQSYSERFLKPISCQVKDSPILLSLLEVKALRLNPSEVQLLVLKS